MVRYYRRRYYRRRPRRYIRRYFRRKFRKYINGSSRSTIRMKTTVEDNFEMQSGTNIGPGAVKMITSYASTAQANGVLNSPLYRTYCNLYEETKLIGMKIAINIVSPVGGADIPSLQIYTAWDRRRGANEAAMTADDIKASSTYNVATALNNNVAKLKRSIYASDLIEKAQWHDCTIGDNQGVKYDQAYVAQDLNPNFFCPAMGMCFQSPTLGANATVKVSVSIVYYCAFRNPKFGGGNADAKLALEARSVIPNAGPIPDHVLDVDEDAEAMAVDDINFDMTHLSIADEEEDKKKPRRPVTAVLDTDEWRKKRAAQQAARRKNA